MTEKLFFGGVFWCFLFFCVFFVCFLLFVFCCLFFVCLFFVCFLFVFCLFVCLFVCFCFLFLLFCFFVFKGQVRWPEGLPHLALNPPHFWGLFCVFVFFSFPFFAFHRKTCFPLDKRIFWFIFECLPLFLLNLFWPPPFSSSLSLSLSFYFLSFFLLVFLC